MRELAEFVPKLANFEEYLCSKFEEGLSLEIQEKMSVSGSQSYKEVVQLALRAEKHTRERRSRVVFIKEKDLVSHPGNHQRRVIVHILLRILLVQELTLLAHHSPSDLYNR